MNVEGSAQLKLINLCIGFAAVAIVVTLAGCGGGGNSGGDPGPGGGSQLSVSVLEANGLTATLAEDRNTVAVGGTVTYTVTLANKTAAPISINISADALTSPPASLTVRNSGGSAVYEPVPGTPPLSSLSLAPGQSLTTTQAVAAYSPAGTYSAVATFFDSAITNAGPLTVTAQ
jgi:hypothetical protein